MQFMKKSLSILILFLFISACFPSENLDQSTPISTAIDTPTSSVVPTILRTNTPIPTTIPTLTASPYPTVQPQISAGDYHTCYLSSTGRVKCWGWNQFGQTGHNSSPEQIMSSDWIDLPGLVQVSAGGYHTCAVNVDHQVYCWGRNNMGQLGNGSSTDSYLPVLVEGLEGARITEVVSGSLHTCAFENKGRAWCWGSNRDGKLGAGIENVFFPIPVLVLAPVDQVIELSLGATFTCAAGGTGQTWCWGDGSFGQTGNKTYTSSPIPQEITKTIPEIKLISSGWFHTCALSTSGEISCWGKNYEGELGNSSTLSRAEAITISGVHTKAGVTLLAVGGRSTCAATLDHLVYCWGNNNYGQVGDGTPKDQLFPKLISTSETGIISLALGASHACYLTENNQLWCWGANDHYQLGVSAPAMVTNPILIDVPQD
jgi:alpha-tubulin suppressor-like RCC1 family protein